MKGKKRIEVEKRKIVKRRGEQKRTVKSNQVSLRKQPEQEKKNQPICREKNKIK